MTIDRRGQEGIQKVRNKRNNEIKDLDEREKLGQILQIGNREKQIKKPQNNARERGKKILNKLKAV